MDVSVCFAIATKEVLNKRRILPFEFLNWAKLDIKNNDRRGIANAITNAKRALHSRIDEILYKMRIPYSKDWNFKASTELKLKMIHTLDISVTTIVKILTERRNDLEHNYLLPRLDDVQLAVESAELWLEKSALYLPITIGMSKLPITRFSINSREETTISITFSEPQEVVLFSDEEKKTIQLNIDGSKVERDYKSYEWKEFIKFQKSFFPARGDYTYHLLLTEIAVIFAAYEEWIVERKQKSFRFSFPQNSNSPKNFGMVIDTENTLKVDLYKTR